MPAQSATLGKLLVQLFLDDDQFHDGLKEADAGVQRTVKKIDKLGGALKGTLVKGFQVATAAALGLVAASAAVGSSFEKQMAAVAAVRGITDLTSIEFKKLEDQARTLGATTAFSATEAAQGMEALARAGLKTNEIIAASETALQLAGANSLELGRSAEILAASMAQFGLRAEEANKVADVFTATAQNSLFSVEGLAQAMKFAGVAGAALGKDIVEVSASVAQFRNLGLEGGMAGTQFRNMMAALAKPTKEATAVIEGMGLKLEDVNPSMNSFRDIMVRLGEAGLDTEEALGIFGKRGAAAVLGVSKKMAASTADFDLLFDSLQSAADQGGLTAETYGTMMNNVSGQMAILRSVTEELFITLFKSFAGPLRDLLASAGELVGEIATEMNRRGAEIGVLFQDIFGTLEGLVKSNQKTTAKAFGDWIVAMLEIARAMKPVISGVAALAALFTKLLPILDEVFIVLSTLFVAQKVLAFVTAVQAAIVVAGGLQAAVTGLAGAVTAATGGLNLAAAAIAALVIGLRLYWKSTDRAAQSTRALARAQAELDAQGEQTRKQFEGIGETLLATTRNEALALKERAAAGEKLQDGLDQELETLLALDAAQAGLMLRTGELVAVNGKLRTVQGAMLHEGVAGQEEVALRVEKTKERIKDLEFRMTMAAGGALLKMKASLKQNQEALFNLRAGVVAAAESQTDAAASAKALENELAGVANSAGGAASEVDKLRESQDEFSAAVAKQLGSLQGGIFDPDDIQREFDQRRESLKKLFADQLKEEKATGARREELEKQLQAGLSAIDDAEFKKRTNAHRKSIEDQVDEARDILERFRDKELTDSERLAKKRDETLLALSGATAEQKLAIAEEFNEEIAALDQAALDQAEEDGEDRKTIWQKIGSAAVVAADLAAVAWEKTMQIIQTFSGFSFDLRDGIQGVIDLQDQALADQVTAQEDIAAAQERVAEAQAALNEAKAGPEVDEELVLAGEEELAAATAELEAAQAALADSGAAVEGGAAGFAAEFVTALIDEAVRFAEVFAEAAGPLLQKLAEGIPDLMAAVVAAIPDVVAAIVEHVPTIIMGIVNALPALIEVLVQGATDIIVMILGLLPELITKLMTEVLPTLIRELTAALPVIITALVEAVPQIIMAVVDSLPALVFAIIDALPTIITELISMMPRIYASIIAQLPEIVGSLLVNLVDNLILALPEIAKEMWNAVIDGMGQAIKAIADAVWDALKDLINIFNKKGKDGEKKGGLLNTGLFAKNSAFSGISYVPATMRMTVHKGEAVVPADRNVQGVADSAPAPAGVAQNFPGSGGDKQSPIEIAVMAEGRLLDAVQVQSMERGKATGVKRIIRRSSGVQVGFSRGRFNSWN